MEKKIFVTQPTLPDLEDFIPYLEKIWESKWLTNNGPFHKKFEKELAEFLGVPYISLFANGTLALVTALQVLGIKGEVITTPYSFVATTHSLWWNKIKPVFVDIEPDYCNLDPEKIELAITPETSAILPVHVYGNPCKVDRIKQISDKHGLKVIYDAAHAFGVKLNNKNICNQGDLSILSFHATKVFNTMEGGAIVCRDAEMKKQIDYLKNFGFADETTVVAPGINSKMNEMQAALGLLQLQAYDKNVQIRKEIDHEYRLNLADIKGIYLLNSPKETESNYAYFPIFVNEQEYGKSRDQLYEKLKKNGIFGRRYFFPLISEFPMYNKLESAKQENLKTAFLKANQVICLPIYPTLELKTIKFIANIISNPKWK
ncbi:MAG: DegT/DnrJ/EryC1/StrS family aminotransferase [Prolixibacteraceae bacterium]|nr:DegT/DnrJ/EryC1/StrS family aminotransferase [Prolixibacteraceae bacterium]